MSNLFYTVVSILAISIVTSCDGQENTNRRAIAENTPVTSKPIGGPCDGCELMYMGMPSEIQSTDTSAGWTEKGQQLMVTGTVYHPDGKTPAPNVIVYYWHTDNDGYYSPREGMDEKTRVHGHIRGWLKTGEDGKYRLYTIKPAPYPKQTLPAHIHFFIKEPNLANAYYPDDLNFEDDTLLIPYLKKYPQEKRCGNGIVKTMKSGTILTAEHNFTLGLNIPNYPKP